ncbi:Orotate phosphoribosyltransferase [Methanimicrococcus hongohii]|uniref:Orotate phosphoribosyltransferase n=1 Tax=Methanimicrococcus hongohii TaxID=3028295 RepID=A0AA96V0K6_9EURY|nr:phosphoribosyltransferase family protein [Methanimicrococcus sp. Hf6]WNY23055.1 Orotate phosphoribosyltransferase [Methanimicrococcus sp. Hf6]
MIQPYPTYELKIAGLTRNLPICPVNEHLDIAGFVIFSDVELTIACVTELLQKVPDCDVLLTAESKGIPLAYEMSRQSGKKYILARKSKKLYMRDPVAVDVKSITTEKMQTLYLDAGDMEYLNGKRVLLIDDVVSTGESMAAMEELCKEAGGIVVGKAAILAEGDAGEREDLIYLEKLPLFFK